MQTLTNYAYFQAYEDGVKKYDNSNVKKLLNLTTLTTYNFLFLQQNMSTKIRTSFFYNILEEIKHQVSTHSQSSLNFKKEFHSIGSTTARKLYEIYRNKMERFSLLLFISKVL